MVNFRYATRTEWARGQLDILSVHSTVERSRKIAGAVSRPFSTMRTRQKLHQHRRLRRTRELVPFCSVIRITEYHGTTGDNLFLFSCVWSESYLLFLPVVNDANFDFGAASLRYYRTHLTKRKKKEGSLLFAVFLLMVISSGPIGSAGRSVLSGCARRHMLSHHMCCPAKERCFCLSVERRLAHDYLERARPGPWAPSPSPPPQELTRSTLHHRGMIASKRGARWALN